MMCCMPLIQVTVIVSSIVNSSPHVNVTVMNKSLNIKQLVFVISKLFSKLSLFSGRFIQYLTNQISILKTCVNYAFC